MRIENNRNKKAFPFQSQELETMKLKMLNWLQPFSIFSYLCTNQNYTTKGTYELLIGLAADDASLYSIEDIANEAHQDWYFGHIAYTYKSFVEKQLENSLPVFNAFLPTLFFRPTSVIYIERNSQSLVIESDQDPILIYNQIMSAQSMVEPIQETLDFETSESQVDYITKIKRIQEHIRMGDCYELNYCVVAQSKLQQTAALQVFASLMQHSPAPFAAYYKFKHQHVLCASPERFLAKTDQLLYSQPIKGTIKRGHDLEQDEIQKNTLSNASKELEELLRDIKLHPKRFVHFSLFGKKDTPYESEDKN